MTKITNQNLVNSRNELEILNLEFLELIESRQEMVDHIQKIKIALGEVGSWSPKREIDLFRKFVKDNPSLDFNYFFMYSMLIETQAGKWDGYPRWSEGEHLEQRSGNLTDFINPVLLFALNETEYASLNLKKSFKEKIESQIVEGN